MMEPFKTIEEGPKMLNPVVIPLPLAVAVIAALALAAHIYRRWLEDTTPIRPAAPARTGRHCLANTPTPYRPRSWDKVTAEIATTTAEPVRYGVLDPEVPLAEVEEYLRHIGVADWSQPLTEFEKRMGAMEPDTRELATVR